MQSGIYVGLSAQIALEKRLETIANNVANAGTAGFRADAVKFEAVLSRSANNTVAFASPGENYISRQTGAISKTDNPLDVAMAGDGWFAFQTPQGVVYTRDGRMQMTSEGELRAPSARSAYSRFRTRPSCRASRIQASRPICPPRRSSKHPRSGCCRATPKGRTSIRLWNSPS